MNIQNAVSGDFDAIFTLYGYASDHQRKIGAIVWPVFDPEMIRQEIATNHQWKLIVDGEVACIWATTFSDEQIWEERNADSAVYIHRIATNPKFRGMNFVRTIVEWAVPHAKALGKKYARLDTLGDNKRLIRHYTEAGFDFLGMFPMKNTEGLPSHYNGEPVCLFQIKVEE
jgi:ribosomal protein S18 acetylase RimI-like enzyme